MKKANASAGTRWSVGVARGRLQTQDEARLERLWTLAPRDKALLERSVTAFARRYPDAPAARHGGGDSTTCGGAPGGDA